MGFAEHFGLCLPPLETSQLFGAQAEAILAQIHCQKCESFKRIFVLVVLMDEKPLGNQ